MFRWLSHAVQDARIAWSFKDYDRSCRQTHHANAEHEFCVIDLEAEIDTLLRPYLREGQVRFGAPIEQLAQEMRDLATKRQKDASQLDLIKRNFSEEISSLYLMRDRLRTDRSEAIEEHKSVLRELHNVQADENWWYRKANCFLLYRNRPIPEFQWIGSDQRDLRHLKERKRELRIDLNEISKNIEDVDIALRSVEERISVIKTDQAKAIMLRRRGIRIYALCHSIALADKILNAHEAEIARQRQQWADFISTARSESGADLLKQKMEDISRAKASFIAEFDTPKASALRREKHREKWFGASGQSAQA